MLSKEFVLDRVHRHEDRRMPYKALVMEYERMMRLDPGFARTTQEAIDSGLEQVIIPVPTNIINMGHRLLSNTPRVKATPEDEFTESAVENAKLRSRWLSAMWDRVNYLAKRNVLGDLKADILSLGRAAVEVKVVSEKIPKARQKYGFPILIRRLNPVNVGIMQGPLYTEWAYHIYEDTIPSVLQRYPDLLEGSEGSKLAGKLDRYIKNAAMGDDSAMKDDTVVEVIDYWWVMEDTGEIGNCVLVDDCFVYEPEATDYPDIPIIVTRGDYYPNIGDEYDGVGLLYPIIGLWEYQCRLLSQLASGLRWWFQPAVTVMNEYGADLGDVTLEPGGISTVPWGTRVDMHQINPNVPLATTIQGQIDAAVQQASFSAVMYGEAGSIQSGYGVSMLADASGGRIKNYLEGMELLVSHVHMQVLALIDNNIKKPITISGLAKGTDEPYTLTLGPKEIRGQYDNHVKMNPAVVQDMMQQQTLGLRLAEAGAISRQTLIEKFIEMELPEDEIKRVALEEAMMSDEMRAKRMQGAIIDFYSEEDEDGNPKWVKYLIDTPLMPQGPEGYHRMPDGTIMSNRAMMEQQQREQEAAAQGPTPNEEQLIQQIIAELTGQGGGGGMPPGMPGMPPTGPAGPAGPPPVQPDAMMAGPMGGGMPPEMQGQMTPEAMGGMASTDPLAFAQLMGQQVPPEEELRLLEGRGR